MNDDILNPRFVYSSFLRPNAPFAAQAIINAAGTWPAAFRERVSSLRKDLHAYA